MRRVQSRLWPKSPVLTKSLSIGAPSPCKEPAFVKVMRGRGNRPGQIEHVATIQQLEAEGMKRPNMDLFTTRDT